MRSEPTERRPRSTPSRRTVLVVTGATVVLLALVGAGAASALLRDDGADSHRAEATRVLQHASGTGEVPAASEALRSQVSTAGGLRVGLRVLLSRHVSVTARTLDGAVAGSADLAAQAEVLRSNSQDLAAAITLVYGEAGGRAFDELWSQHAQFLVAYASARGESDHDAVEEARARLDDYHQDFTSFCNLATGLPEPAVSDLIGGHLDRLLAYADAVAAGDRTRSTDLLDRALEEVVVIADALAAAIVASHADVFPGAVDDPATQTTAEVVAGVERSAALVIEAQRADLAEVPTVAVPGLPDGVADAWADLVAATGTEETASAGRDDLIRAAQSSGAPEEQVVALARATDVWLASLADHRSALADPRPEDAVAAADEVELGAVDLGVALAALVPAGRHEGGE